MNIPRLDFSRLGGYVSTPRRPPGASFDSIENANTPEPEVLESNRSTNRVKTSRFVPVVGSVGEDFKNLGIPTSSLDEEEQAKKWMNKLNIPSISTESPEHSRPRSSCLSCCCRMFSSQRELPAQQQTEIVIPRVALEGGRLNVEPPPRTRAECYAIKEQEERVVGLNESISSSLKPKPAITPA